MATTKFLSNIIITGANGTVLDVQGSVGQLFSITDSLTGDLFAVSDISGIPILNVNSSGAVDIDGTLNLGDSDKIQLGASQDLQIYHDGTNSYVNDTGVGDLIIKGGNDITFKDAVDNLLVNMNQSNSVELYYGGSKKFETYNAGVGITGNAYLASGSYVHFDNGLTNDYAIRKTSTNLEFKTGGAYNFLSGNATFAGDVTVTGGDLTLGTDSIASNINAVGDVLAINVDSNTGGGAGANIQLKTAGTTQLTINSSTASFAGNVSIGNTAPAQKLHVTGNQVRLDTAAGGYYLHNGSGTFRGAFHDNGTTTNIFGDGNGSTAAISIESNNSTFAGRVTHNGIELTSGFAVDQIREFPMTFQLTANTWADTGIDGTDLSTGTYAMQVYVSDFEVGGNHYYEYYSATIAWYGGGTNSTVVDEIPVHRAGHAPNTGDIQFRTQRASGSDSHDLMLQVKHNKSYTGALDNDHGGKIMRFKFRRLM